MSAGGHGVMMRGKWGACLGLLLVCVLSGCHHRQAPPTLPAVVRAPVQPPPTPAAPSMASPPPESITTAPTVRVTEAVKPKRRPKKAAGKGALAAPAVEVAAAPAAVQASPIGELSPGGESTPALQREANELIASGERRLEVLAKKSGQEQIPVREVRHFLQQAREALGTGDAEGARTLATKAKLLMDDLEKAGQE